MPCRDTFKQLIITITIQEALLRSIRCIRLNYSLRIIFLTNLAFCAKRANRKREVHSYQAVIKGNTFQHGSITLKLGTKERWILEVRDDCS